MKTKFLLAFLSVLSVLTDARSQDTEPSKNSIFIEVFGNGGLYSINYERNLNSNLYGRFGFGRWASTDLSGFESKLTTFPVLITYITDHEKHHFEIGGGFLFGSIKEELSESEFIFDFSSFLGYRFQKTDKGFLFRIGLTPLISLNETNYPDEIMLSGGISFGYHFRLNPD